MTVTVKLFATLREHGEKIQELILEDGTTVADIVKRMELPAEDIAIIMVNGRHVKLTRVLEEADVLALFPPVGGG